MPATLTKVAARGKIILAISEAFFKISFLLSAIRLAPPEIIVADAGFEPADRRRNIS